MTTSLLDQMQLDSAALKASAATVHQIGSQLSTAQAKLQAFDARWAGKTATSGSLRERADLAARVAQLESDLAAAQLALDQSPGLALAFPDSP